MLIKTIMLMGSSLASLTWTTPAVAQTSGNAGTDRQAVPPSSTILEQEEEATDIVVSGIRRSIDDALNTKRSAVNIIDSISAQDIGKLPDQQVLDTLSRIPGVQIVRRQGEAQNFTIRGISLNNVLINGRTFIGASAEADAGLDVLAPDVVASIDVIKTPAADEIEGALGGTVNLKTKRPLSLPDMTITGRAQMQYADDSHKLGFRGSALVSKKFFDERVGLLVNVAYQHLHSNPQAYDNAGFAATNAIDGNRDGINDPGLFRQARAQTQSIPRTIDRLTLNGALQVRPTDTLELNIDATYNYYNSFNRPNRLQILLNDNDVGAVADANRTVVSGVFTGVTARPLAFVEQDKSRVFVVGGNLAWNYNGWSVAVDGSYSLGKSPISRLTATPVITQRAGRNVDARINLVDGADVPGFILNSNFDQLDQNQYQLNTIVDQFNKTDNSGASGRIDLGREIDFSFLSRINVGYRYEDRRLRINRFTTNLPLSTFVAARDANRDGIVSTAEIPGLRYTGLLSNNILTSLSGQFPSNFLSGTLDLAALRAGFGYEPVLSPTQTNNIRLETNAFYGKLDMKGDIGGLGFRGNIGARLVKSKRSATGNISVPNLGIVPVNFEKATTDWLPSATLNFDISEDVVFRLAAARVLASPPLNDLAPGFTFSQVSNLGTGGNPLLEPFKTDQIDASFEWYFAKSSLFAVSLFYKDVKSFTQLSVTEETIPGFVSPNGLGNVILVTRPVNGGEGEAKGVEVNYQHAFTFLPGLLSGLGIQANYTYADSKTPFVDELTRSPLPLPQLSKHSYSVIGYYEKGPVSVRAAYTYRSSFLFATQPANRGGSRFVGPQDQLDASVSLAVLPNLKLTFDAQNLLKSPEIRFDGVESRISLVSIDDRRYFLGVSAAF